ncbi:MAG: glycosyltransferase [Flavobacteriaceae bacterium]|nr:glycosyltransferase [Flavobacteriaceae bacterium]
MRILQVTTSSKGGAGIAALRLHTALRDQGISSAFLSKDLTIDFDGNSIQDNFFNYRKASLISRIRRKWSVLFFKSLKYQIQKEIESHGDQLSYEMVSPPFSSWELEKHPLIRRADIVNLHMVTGIVAYDRFFSQLNKPLVWTLHDMNPFMGLFHYKGDQDANGLLKKMDQDVKSLKQKALMHCKQGAIASPSKWLLDACTKSDAFHHFSEKIVIPNSIDLKVFHPKVHSLREELGILPNEKVLLFAAGSLHIDRKGFALLNDALANLSVPITLITLGKGMVQLSNEAVKVIPLGFKSDPREIAACYATADACILPSKEDNLPNTMLEAFATGTPVISFPNGGMKEHIQNGFNGVVANAITSNALKKAIETFFNTLSTYDSEPIRRYAEEHFDANIQAKAYEGLYTRLLNP